MRLLALIVVIVVLVAAAWAVAIAVRRAREAARPVPPRPDPFGAEPSRPDPRNLKVGDVVTFEGRDYVVRGTLRLDQSGYSWQEHLLDDTRRRRWLSVEDDEGLELCLWDRMSGSTLQPGSPDLNHDGVEFRLSERGKATFRSEGTTGTAPSGEMEYVDYAAGDDRVSFERFGEKSWVVSRGRVLRERELTIYPITD